MISRTNIINVTEATNQDIRAIREAMPILCPVVGEIDPLLLVNGEDVVMVSFYLPSTAGIP